jgi:hypothetical protein
VRIANGGDFVLFRTFHAITTRIVPHRHPHLTVLCTLTGGHGQYPVEVAVVNARAMMDVAVSRSIVNSNNPLGITDAVTEFFDVLLPEPGKYWIEMRCQGEIIAQRPFHLHFKPPQPGRGERAPTPVRP